MKGSLFPNTLPQIPQSSIRFFICVYVALNVKASQCQGKCESKHIFNGIRIPFATAAKGKGFKATGLTKQTPKTA